MSSSGMSALLAVKAAEARAVEAARRGQKHQNSDDDEGRAVSEESNANKLIARQNPEAKPSDKKETSKHFQQPFLGIDMTSDLLSMAIGGQDAKEEENGESKVPAKKIPVPGDLIPIKASLTAEEVAHRVANWTVFDMRDESLRGQPSQDLMATPAVYDRTLGCRKLVNTWAANMIRHHFVANFRIQYPDFKFKNGTREVNCVDDLTQLVRYGPYDDSVRDKVFFALHGLWETSNGCFKDMEDRVCDKFGWKFTSYNCNGTAKLRKTNSSCIKKAFVRQKNIVFAPLRNTLRKRRFEGILVRRQDLSLPALEKKRMKKLERKKAKDPEIVNLDCDGIVEDDMPPLKKIIVATNESYGFDGYLGLYEGHTLLNLVDKEKGASEDSASDFLERVSSKKAKMTKRDLLMALKAEVEADENAKKEAQDLSDNWDPLMQLLPGSIDLSNDDVAVLPARYISPAVQHSLESFKSPSQAAAVGTMCTVAKKSPRKQVTPETPKKASAKRKDPLDAPDFNNSDEILGVWKSPKKQPMTPVKKRASVPCKHAEQLAQFVEISDGRYFMTNYLDSKDYYPTECGICKTGFTGDKVGSNDGRIKVSKKTPVRACKNACLCDENECVFALCNECFPKAICGEIRIDPGVAGSPCGRKGRKKRRKVQMSI